MNPRSNLILALPLVFRGKRLFSVSLHLAVREAGLSAVLGGRPEADIAAEEMPAGLDGLLLSGAVDQGWRTHAVLGDRVAFVLSRDVWHYLGWPGSYEDFVVGRYSAKTREAFERDEARFAEAFGGGRLDLRTYRSPAEIAEFVGHVEAIRARGGASGESVTRAELERAAQRGEAHGFVLFAEGEPVAQVCLLADGDTLRHAGADERSDFRQWSAGTLVHLQAFRRLFADGRYRYVDFRPGDGEVKRQFSNGALRSVVVLQLRRTLRNRLLLALLDFTRRASSGRFDVSDEIRAAFSARA